MIRLMMDVMMDLIILNLNYKSMETYIGTGIYKAPEIDTKKYNSSIDIYSLGIIMIELFINFTTQSEKIFLVLNLKKTFDLQIRYRNIQEDLQIIKENLELFKDLMQYKKSNLLEWIVILLILIEVVNLVVDKFVK